MPIEVYVFKEGSIRRQPLLSDNDVQNGAVCEEYKFMNKDGAQYSLFFQLNEGEVLEEIKDINVAIYTNNS